MAQIVADRVKETSTTTGTGSYSLAGAVSGFQAFSAVLTDGDTAYYAAVEDGAGWEVGLGTWATGDTLTRTTILASSNSGSAVNWSAGTREIFITLPARAATVDVQTFQTAGTSTWTKPIGAKLVHVVCIGGGAGGGSGRRRSVGDSNNAGGGSGGGGGSRTEAWLLADNLTGTITVTVGDGGGGGAARTVDGTNGNAGSGGKNSSFGAFVLARLGVQASLSTTTGGGIGSQSGSFPASTVGTTILNGTAGTGSTTTAGTPAQYGTGGGGGAGGAGVSNASPTTGLAGGFGGAGSGRATVNNQTLTTGSGGAGGSSGNAGASGNAASDPQFGGDGGGGGGNGTTYAAGAGGDGGAPGGGGGGGGASNAGYDSGAGGNGADGAVVVTTWF